jgi:hypothetical protein
MMYPDDLAYLVFAIQDARDYGKVAAADFHKMPPFIFDYLMMARLLYTLCAVWVLAATVRYVPRVWRTRGWAWICNSVVLGLGMALSLELGLRAYQAWAHPVEWLSKQFIQFN